MAFHGERPPSFGRVPGRACHILETRRSATMHRGCYVRATHRMFILNLAAIEPTEASEHARSVTFVTSKSAVHECSSNKAEVPGLRSGHALDAKSRSEADSLSARLRSGPCPYDFIQTYSGRTAMKLLTSSLSGPS